MPKKKLKVRALEARDFFALMRVLSAAFPTADDVQRVLPEAMFRESANGDMTIADVAGAIYGLLVSLATRAEDELIAWFADLCDMSAPEFNQQGPSAIITVARSIASDSEGPRFFESAQAWLADILPAQD